LEYESISFFASSNKFKAAESPLFSGLLNSELQARKNMEKKVKVNFQEDKLRKLLSEEKERLGC
jgi:hypothetical protein